MGLAEDYAKYLGESNRLLKNPLKEAKKVLEGASEEKIEKIKKMIEEDANMEKGIDNVKTSLAIGKLGSGKNKNPKKTGEGLKEGKGTDFGMLSVEAGIDNNPKPTQADRIAGATKGEKKKAKGGVRTAIAKIKKAKDGSRTGVRGTGAAKRGFRKAKLS
jgi:hypothetical protein